ncbi:uncharacterized membrane protein YphA (DoxX/SURF4 family) [Jatrophihabitans sp. GAS493]|uniref:DoxX family protein n=1 Tax=Jatrophihabitans sp. GAS493 TaxID=1907575 RepID=UPI000BB79B5A|nr:DoxX family protein [Jatrophihabitans sp. GAS493]SOD71022.1 uncharacterized membrane protein YphA (DoxX/SURF4 family) [Jatrophihabitans sp. GAS493]
MALVRKLARPLLASVFVVGGIDAIRHPAGKAPSAEKVTGRLVSQLPGVTSTEQLVRLDGVAKVVGGIALGTGTFPRLASLVLVGSMVPTTVAGHAFWDEQDPSKRAAQRLQFIKNGAILGGLLLAAVDTEGKPSIGWRARRTARELRRSAKSAGAAIGETTHSFGLSAQQLGQTAQQLGQSAQQLGQSAQQRLPI